MFPQNKNGYISIGKFYIGKTMKVSIITAVYNNTEFIEDCIRSVLDQSYKNIEHIIIDGGSTDGTLEVIKKYNKYISKWISESDKGIYDAINKGIDIATGDIVGILNSDDFYVNNEVINKIVKVFERRNIDAVYADLVYVDVKNTDRIVRFWKSGEYKEGSFKRGWHPPHPTFFVKKECYNKYGLYDLNFPVSADFELMLRLIEKYKIKVAYLPEVIIKMRIGGESNKSLINIFKGNLNVIKAFKKNNIDYCPLYPIYRLLPKLIDKIRRKFL